MNTIALTTALLAAGGAQAVEIAFAPNEGLRLVKTVLVRHEMNLDEMGSTREGGPLLREDSGGWLTAGTRQSTLDEYIRVADGRPTQFRRTLRVFEGNARMLLTGGRGIDITARYASPLAGFAVMHTWVPEEETWGRCFDYLASDEEQLEVLDDDADFLGFLPGGPVEVGASWVVEPDALRCLFAPGGNTGARPGEDGYFERMVEVGVGGDMADVLGEELAGSASATLQELREDEDGRRLAVLALQFSVVSERDRTRTYLMGMPKEEKRESSGLQQVLLTWTADGDGELLWDLEAGHFAGASAEAHETLTAEIFKVSAVDGVPMNVSQRSTYSGQIEIEHKVREGSDQDVPALESSEEQGPVKPRKGRKKRKKDSDG